MPIKPKGTVNRSNEPITNLNFAFFDVEETQIAAWSSDPKGEGPVTQVHLVQKLKDFPYPVVLRFKGPDTLGFLIEELARYRREVWPEAAPVDTSGEWPEGRPVVVCLCGSTRFFETFQKANLQET